MAKRVIKNVPKFDVGEVIDISYKSGGLPNRVKICAVFWRSQDIEWTYQVIMENLMLKTTMTEEFLATRKSNMTADVYKNPDIIKRIEDGFRWCGNHNIDNVYQQAKLIAECYNVVDVRIYPALFPNNTLARTKKAIWIRYRYPISNNGTQMDNGDYAEVIKGV